jgi:D-glycero-alpha-D-manno-heptose-7-phosphate kinase
MEIAMAHIGVRRKEDSSLANDRSQLIRAKAPLRISFAGGGTDVSPFPEQRGGCVLSCSIDKYSYCTLTSHENNKINITSKDYNLFTSYNVDELLNYDGKLGLVKAALSYIKVEAGLDILLHSDVPPGSGLGASSSMTVALAGALTQWQRLHLSDYQIAELAYKVERVEAGIKGGRQDQYATTFGGFNMIEFFGDKTVVNPLNISADILNELQYRLILCYTGKRRLSAGIIEDQVKGYIQQKDQVVDALEKTKELVFEMKNALLLGEIDEFGRMLHRGWIAKKQFSKKISDPDIDKLYQTGIENGALGGKLLGAGGGGYILFLCEFDKRHQVVAHLEEQGGEIMNFAFDLHGLQIWEARSQ